MDFRELKFEQKVRSKNTKIFTKIKQTLALSITVFGKLLGCKLWLVKRVCGILHKIFDFNCILSSTDLSNHYYIDRDKQK